MDTITIISAEVDDKAVLLKPDADLSEFDPALVRRRVFDVRAKSAADSFLAVDMAYDVLDATGIKPGKSGYPPGAWTAAQRVAAAFVRCTKLTDGETVIDAPKAADLIALPPEVWNEFANRVSQSGAMTRDEFARLKKVPTSGEPS